MVPPTAASQATGMPEMPDLIKRYRSPRFRSTGRRTKASTSSSDALNTGKTFQTRSLRKSFSKRPTPASTDKGAKALVASGKSPAVSYCQYQVDSASTVRKCQVDSASTVSKLSFDSASNDRRPSASQSSARDPLIAYHTVVRDTVVVADCSWSTCTSSNALNSLDAFEPPCLLKLPDVFEQPAAFEQPAVLKPPDILEPSDVLQPPDICLLYTSPSPRD